ncbi:hypothetical protein M0M57_15530 [Flavobacterium azooxidireducens]|uniref:Uncharacterized protein n=1 Tax=Flavobacterium azooxidireducens TaxID=1871076 RepID=A0ABY4KE13_9FLAO|nr:hypothetical protein [Flavobacterium azooxidireducens]UPQ79017.1 hypothetical protein M0M57_15530 [Flavobacterium azooxidireducens]
MKEALTVDQAILKGKLTIVFFKLFILLLFVALGILSVAFFKIHFAVGLFGGIISGFFLMKIYWKYASKRWQIWAFESVNHVHELKRKAIDLDFITNNFILDQKLTSKDLIYIQKINYIQKKFEVEDKYYDDLSTPKEIQIFISKPFSVLFFIIGLGFVFSAIYSYFKFNFEFINLILLFVFGLLFVISSVKILLQKEPEIIMNINGIQIRKQNFISWNDIQSCYVENRKMNGNNYKSNFLVIVFLEHKIEHKIDGLKIKPDLIDKYIKVYTTRTIKQ